ncbi:hypothetical protein FQA39_LY17735 [Lamprigera yunnana]|nr:hypothetical protein FQA39_LY17735 [Lamprigera yunnana]
MAYKELLLLYNVIILTHAASVKRDEFTGEFPTMNPAPDSRFAKEDKEYWINQGTVHLHNILVNLNKKENPVAKNLIIFIGDGMGITSATAGRIYKGQRNGEMGEESSLFFERFPNVALSKTYNVDHQVPDSAGTATAIFTGVKARFKLIGLDVRNKAGEFDEGIYELSKINSLMTWAQAANKSTGIVTNTRITHATPAGTYAHIPHRDWECDALIPKAHRNSLKDIARQLVEDEPGYKFKVILGGGQEQMGYVNLNQSSVCPRSDGLNLTEKWMRNHKDNKAHFVTNKADLNSIPNDTEYLLGLFSENHMPYELIRRKSKPDVPSLTEMTLAALKILKNSSQGYALMVEGGLIDRAHHQNFARLAMEELSEFDNAVGAALEHADSDTLIVVTSDHSHSFAFSGYPARGNDILGAGNVTIPYLTLSYANGPGFNYHYVSPEDKLNKYPWRNVMKDRTRLTNPFYRQLAAVYLKDDTHGGEDVPIYAKGPGSNLFRGVMEQSNIAHIVSYAMCIGPQKKLNPHCNCSSAY